MGLSKVGYFHMIPLQHQRTATFQITLINEHVMEPFITRNFPHLSFRQMCLEQESYIRLYLLMYLKRTNCSGRAQPVTVPFLIFYCSLISHYFGSSNFNFFYCSLTSHCFDLYHCPHHQSFTSYCEMTSRVYHHHQLLYHHYRHLQKVLP